MADWLSCIPWDGEEASLPVGIHTMIPNFRASNLVRFYEVLDVESDEGYKTLTKKEYDRAPKDTILIGVQINENSLKRIQRIYKDRSMTFKMANGGPWYTREEWEIATRPDPDTRGMDVLELQALKEIRNMRGVFNIKG